MPAPYPDYPLGLITVELLADDPLGGDEEIVVGIASDLSAPSRAWSWGPGLPDQVVRIGAIAITPRVSVIAVEFRDGDAWARATDVTSVLSLEASKHPDVRTTQYEVAGMVPVGEE